MVTRNGLPFPAAVDRITPATARQISKWVAALGDGMPFQSFADHVHSVGIEGHFCAVNLIETGIGVR